MLICSMARTSGKAYSAVRVSEDVDVQCLWAMHFSRVQLMHARWARFSVRCIEWDVWPADIWAGLTVAVESLETASVEACLFHAPAERMLRKVSDDFCPLCMTQADGPMQVVRDIRAFAQLLDRGYRPKDAWMRAFAISLNGFLVTALQRHLSFMTVRLARQELGLRKVTGVVTARVGKRRFVRAPEVSEISRIQVVSVCMHELKAAANFELDHRRPMSSVHLDAIRTAMYCLELGLTEDALSADEELGILYFVTAVRHPNNRVRQALNLNLAGQLLKSLSRSRTSG